MDERSEIMHDDFGPEKVVEVYDPKTGMHGFTVIDNTALGPGKGGIRMTPTVSAAEVCRLARAMTWKCSLADLPFGGGKSGIQAPQEVINDPKRKKQYMQAFARAVKHLTPNEYIAAPDMNTAEEEMRWFAEIAGRSSCTGKPKDIGGIPHELGSTGFGVYHSTLVAMNHLKMNTCQTGIAVEGFGNVGSFAAKFLWEKGAKIVAVSDSKGCIYDPTGIDFKKLCEVKQKTCKVSEYTKFSKTAKALKTDDLFQLDVDVIIPSAIPDVINESNVNKIKAKLIVEGANIPMTEETEEKLHKRGILVVPDFVANAGGVISSYIEFKGGTPEQMFNMVEEKVSKNTKLVLERTSKQKSARKAAFELAVERVRNAMKKR